MFVFYYAIISNITPPVALAAYAASSIAGSDPNKTGFQAMQLGFLAYVVPFAFCYDPGLLMQGDWPTIAWSLLSGIGAVFAFAYAWMGYISARIPLWMRGTLLASGFLCLSPLKPAVLLGVAIVVGAHLLSRKQAAA